MKKLLLFALATAVANAAVAQNAARPDPNDASAAVPAFTYRSAFEGYRPFVEQDVADWRKANEEVRDAKPPARKTKPAPAVKGHGGP